MLDGPSGVTTGVTNQTNGVDQAQVTQGNFKDRAIRFAKGFARVVGAILTLGISEAVIQGIQSYKARIAQTNLMDAKATITLSPEDFDPESLYRERGEMFSKMILEDEGTWWSFSTLFRHALTSLGLEGRDHDSGGRKIGINFEKNYRYTLKPLEGEIKEALIKGKPVDLRAAAEIVERTIKEYIPNNRLFA